MLCEASIRGKLLPIAPVLLAPQVISSRGFRQSGFQGTVFWARHRFVLADGYENTRSLRRLILGQPVLRP